MQQSKHVFGGGTEDEVAVCVTVRTVETIDIFLPYEDSRVSPMRDRDNFSGKRTLIYVLELD